MHLLSKAVSHCMSKDYSVKIYTEYLNLLKNIHRSAITFNTKDYYPIFLFEDILQRSAKENSVHYRRRSSYLLQDIDMVERVERTFTKSLPGMRNISYLDRLETLQLESLESRRIYFDLLFL